MAAFTMIRHIVQGNGRWGTDMIEEEEGKKKKKDFWLCPTFSLRPPY